MGDSTGSAGSGSRVTWDPAQYGHFGDHRSRPFHELVARIAADDPRYVVDLGCGPGPLTANLAERWPNAVVEGVDNSPEMLAAAAAYARPGRISFTEGDASTWRPDRPIDVLVSNATLHWVPEHAAVIADLTRHLRPGGWIAVQMPANHDTPIHTLIQQVLRTRPEWAPAAEAVVTARDDVRDPVDYYRLLADAGCTVDAWETTYVQVLPGEDAVLDWAKGTALRPVQRALSTADFETFLGEYAEALRPVYPRTPRGTLLPYRRVFAVAQRDR